LVKENKRAESSRSKSVSGIHQRQAVVVGLWITKAHGNHRHAILSAKQYVLLGDHTRSWQDRPRSLTSGSPKLLELQVLDVERDGNLYQ
jgi:hypothetical protein